MLDRKKHWEKIYGEKKPDEVSWYQAHPQRSLELIRQAGVAKDGRVIDVGGGASRLVDLLLDEGFRHVSVLDISAGALRYAQERLGSRKKDVTWIESDVTESPLEGIYDLWHDRAVFHFLTEEGDRSKYLDGVRKALKSGGHLILAAFALDGPEKCSGLPVRRYDAALLRETLGADFDLLREIPESHKTPWETEQKFNYFLLKRK